MPANREPPLTMLVGRGSLWVSKITGQAPSGGFLVAEERPGLFLLQELQAARTEQELTDAIKEELRRGALAPFALVVGRLQ